MIRKVSSKRYAAQAARIVAATDEQLMEKMTLRDLIDTLRGMAASVLSQAEKK
jgi:hypothetical protein